MHSTLRYFILAAKKKKNKKSKKNIKQKQKRKTKKKLFSTQYLNVADNH